VNAVQKLLEKGANIQATNKVRGRGCIGILAHALHVTNSSCTDSCYTQDGKTAMHLAKDDTTRSALRKAAQEAPWRDVVAFLERHSLSQFAPALKSEQIGVTCLDDLRHFDEPGLKNVGMSYIQQKKFLEAVKNLAQKRARPDGHVDSEPAAQHPRH
jgi:hypothetical protein